MSKFYKIFRSPPFHIARRGWGEFPLRVRLYFKCSLNKPVDIVHNLKLDKSHSGRQTLGNETVFEMNLFEENNDINMPLSDVSILKTDETKDESNTSVTFKLVNNGAKLNNLIGIEHSYTLVSDIKSSVA